MGIRLFEGAQEWVGVCMRHGIDQDKMRHGELMWWNDWSVNEAIRILRIVNWLVDHGSWLFGLNKIPVDVPKNDPDKQKNMHTFLLGFKLTHTLKHKFYSTAAEYGCKLDSGFTPCRPSWLWPQVLQPVCTGWLLSLQTRWRTCYHGWFPQLWVALVPGWGKQNR